MVKFFVHFMLTFSAHKFIVISWRHQFLLVSCQPLKHHCVVLAMAVVSLAGLLWTKLHSLAHRWHSDQASRVCRSLNTWYFEGSCVGLFNVHS